MRRKSDSDGEDASGADPALELAVLLGTDEEESEMRPIDADALLENYGLKDAVKYGNKDALQQSKSYSTLMLYEIANLIEDAPTIEPSANWTPCSEGMPESGKLNDDGSPKLYRVFVVDNNGLPVPIEYQSDATREFDTWINESGYEFDEWEEVIAWFELPAPYNPNKAQEVRADGTTNT